MATPFIGEIRMFGGTFAPTGWSFCNGQILQTNQNEALFSLLGSTYGGDGRTTFALPDLRGRVPIHVGQGPNLPNYAIGAKSGSESETITSNNLPVHNHNMVAAGTPSDQASPIGQIYGQTINSNNSNAVLTMGDATNTTMNSGMLTSYGSASPGSLNNFMPFLTINYIIALTGLIPSQT